MPSKIVADKQKSARAVVEFGRTNAEKIAGGIAALQTQALPPDTDHDIYRKHLLTLVTSSSTFLEERTQRMIDADEAYLIEQADDDEPRRKRDEAGATLREALVSLRGTIGGVYSPQATRDLGFSSDTPEDPVLLSRFAGEVLKIFEKKQQEGSLPAPKEGLTFNPQGPLAKITLLRSSLDGHLGKVETERRELQQALSKKNDTLAAYDDAFKRVANLFVGLCLMAGEKELAQKIRPSGRNPGQLAPEEEPSGEIL